MLGQQLDSMAYHVLPGDSLSKIIKRYYGAVSPQRYQAIIKQIQHDNPKVTNPNHIKPNQLLLIDIPPQYCAAPSDQKTTPLLNINKQQLKSLQNSFNTANAKERSVMSQLAPVMLGTGSAGLMSIKTSFQTNAPQLTSLVNLYEEYKANKITKGQYDYGRKKIITKFTERMGPVKHILSGRKKHRQILRISRSKGKVPTGNITRHISSMGKMAKYASKGGAILTVAGLGLACNEIANTKNQLKKNHILVESVGGVLGGVAYGIGATIAIVIMATPVGWVAALVIGAGSVAASLTAGQAAKLAYDKFGNTTDLASLTGVSTLCR